MSFLFLRAYLKLMYFDFYLRRKDFAALYDKVRNYPTRAQTALPRSTEKVCAAINMACIWYWKEVLCLQRSAATVCLLRRYGVPALMMLGGQQMPFRAHAWIEADGRVVNDKPYIREIYTVLDQC